MNNRKICSKKIITTITALALAAGAAPTDLGRVFTLSAGIAASALTASANNVPTVNYEPGENSVKLSWTKVDGAEAYGIAGFKDGKWQRLYKRDYNETSFTMGGLVPGTDYKVAVIAMINGEWVMDFSNAIIVTPKASGAPCPTISSVDYNEQTGQAILSWNEVLPAQQYGIAGFKDGKWQLLYKTKETSFTMDGLAAGPEYKVAVIAMINGEWVMDFSYYVVISSQSPSSPYPNIKSAVYDEQTAQLNIIWDKVDTAERYAIAGKKDGKWQVLYKRSNEETTYAMKGLTEGEKYTIAVVAMINGEWDITDLESRSVTVNIPAAKKIYEKPDFEFSGNVYLVGDSTVCEYTPDTIRNLHRSGWGMELENQFKNVNVINYAIAGSSSRSFVTQNKWGYYTQLCKNLKEGDYLFIQFGHNDEVIKGKTGNEDLITYPNLTSQLDAEGKDSEGRYSYEWILYKYYIKLAVDKGATPVLVTPITRRNADGTPRYAEHEKYAAAMRKLGRTNNVPVIDMTEKTVELYNKLYEEGGPEATKEMHCIVQNGDIDNTHLSVYGSGIIADIIAHETKELGLKISEREIEDDNYI